ncbi:MAG TPA: DoxX family protein [Burkholderiales bacterium]|nr:DoxX family protein [Burkholderiales bacterium]
MLFFALLVVLTSLAIPLVRGWPARMRLAMALALFFAGSDHWINPQRYLAMMPPWIPLHLELVLFTGAAEIAGGLGLLVPRFRQAAGLLLAIYFVAVFPANVHNALNGLAVEGLPQAAWYYWLRLPFQPLAVWWALFSAELIRWPFVGRSRTQVHS